MQLTRRSYVWQFEKTKPTSGLGGRHGKYIRISKSLQNVFGDPAMAKWQRFVLGAKGFRFRLELVSGSRLARCSFGLAESKSGSRLVLNWLRAKNKSAKFVTEGRVSP